MEENEHIFGQYQIFSSFMNLSRDSPHPIMYSVSVTLTEQANYIQTIYPEAV